MELRKYQIDIAHLAANKLQQYGLVYLALETRTGKTITAMETCKLMGVKKVLFITKKKAISSIKGDYKHYIDAFEITIINYESVIKFKDRYDIAICDEAHMIGAFPKPAKRWKDARSVIGNIPVILMSATPSPESYSQLFHQFTINGKHSWCKARNFYEWSKYYVNKKIRYLYNREVPDYSDAKIDMVKHSTDDYMITYTQQAAGFNVEVEEKILICPMLPSTYENINRLNIDKVIYIDGRAILADTSVKLMQKVHQLSSGSVIDEEGTGMITDASKAIFIYNQFAGKKIAIFYKFKQEFELLKNIFYDWTDSPDVFQNEERTYLGQFVSSREGIRLDNADALIFFNIDFSYLSYEQSRNRIMSKERTNRAPLYWIFADGGIEQKIYHVVKSKSDYTLTHYKKDYGIRRTKSNNSGSN